MIIATLVANYDGNGEFTSVSIEYSANFVNALDSSEKSNIMSEVCDVVASEYDSFVEAEWEESEEETEEGFEEEVADEEDSE